MVLVQVFSRDELEDRVAEILEAFVVARRDGWALVGEGAVRDGFEEKLGVAKMNPDLLLQ